MADIFSLRKTFALISQFDFLLSQVGVCNLNLKFLSRGRGGRIVRPEADKETCLKFLSKLFYQLRNIGSLFRKKGSTARALRQVGQWLGINSVKTRVSHAKGVDGDATLDRLVRNFAIFLLACRVITIRQQ